MIYSKNWREGGREGENLTTKNTTSRKTVLQEGGAKMAA